MLCNRTVTLHGALLCCTNVIVVMVVHVPVSIRQAIPWLELQQVVHIRVSGREMVLRLRSDKRSTGNWVCEIAHRTARRHVLVDSDVMHRNAASVQLPSHACLDTYGLLISAHANMGANTFQQAMPTSLVQQRACYRVSSAH